MGVMLTTATLIASAFVVLLGIFSMNIQIELFENKESGMTEFLWTVGGGAAGKSINHCHQHPLGAVMLGRSTRRLFCWNSLSNVLGGHSDISQIACKLDMVTQGTWHTYCSIDTSEDNRLDIQSNSLVAPKEGNELDGSFEQEISGNGVQMEYNKEDLCKVCKILSSPKEWNVMAVDLDGSAACFNPELAFEVLCRYKKHGHIALHFFSWLKNAEGYAHTTKTYNMAIKIAGSAKDFKHMRNLYLEMRRQRCLVTPDTWAIMISQYGQAGLTEMALKKFQEMKSEGYVPNASTYKFLIIFLCGKKGRKVDEAVSIFQEMVHSGYLPDNEMIEAYLSCLCESNKILEARKSVDLLCTSGLPVQISKSMFIRALSRAGKLEDALELSKQLDNLGYPMTKYMYGSLVHGLLRVGCVNEALVKVEEMKKAGISCTVHIYTSLMVHYLKMRKIDQAKDTFKRMIQDGCLPTVVTYSAFIRGLVSNGMFSDAWNIFNRMKNEGPPPDFKTYSMFIDSLCKAGRSGEGLLLLHEMLRKEIFPSTVNFRTVFYGLNREGKQCLAQSVLHAKWGLSRKRKFLA